MFVQIIALAPKMALIRESIVLHRLIKGNVKNLQVSHYGPLVLKKISTVVLNQTAAHLYLICLLELQ